MRLDLENVSHVYAPGTPFEFQALRNASMSVLPEEVICIVGGTGSGKSTLVMHMNGLLAPTSGRVLVGGADARNIKRGELRSQVGLVFQFPEAALFAPTVREDVAFGPRQLGLAESEVTDRVKASLVALRAEHLVDRSPFALSGGEKRRVAIASVLAMGPQVLVLDEPTAGLDPAAREDLLCLIRGLREAGVSVVFVSHDLEEVAEIADRVCVMHAGEIRAVGKPAEIFYAASENAPATVRVVDAVRNTHPEVGKPVRYGETLAALRALFRTPA